MTLDELKVLSEVSNNLNLINIERTPATLVRLLALQARDAIEKLIKDRDKLSNH
jgi:pantothenate kinase